MSFLKLRLGCALGLATGLWLVPVAHAQPSGNSSGAEEAGDGDGDGDSNGDSDEHDSDEHGSDEHDSEAPQGPRFGEDAEARGLFEAGRAAYGDGRFEDALDHFRRAHELSGRPKLLFNIANTAERLRRDQEALDAYERYLQEMPDADNRPFVEERITALRETIPTSDGGAGGAGGGGGAGHGGGAGGSERSWLERRPILGPAILGGVGLVGLSVMIGGYAAEGCNVRAGNRCLAGKQVAAGPMAVYGIVAAGGLVGGVLWLTLGERGGGDGDTQVGVGPQGVWLRGRF